MARARLGLTVVVALALALAGCSDDDEDPSGPGPAGIAGTYVGTGYFGIAGTPQPITIVIDRNGSTFGGTVTTENVPDGPINGGTWDGTTARWTTSELGSSAEWQATVSAGVMSGSTTNIEFSFTATRP